MFFFIFLIAFVVCIVNAKTIAVKAKSVVVALEIYKKYNVKISPRYVENISSYEIKDVDVCDLKLCSWEKDDCTEWVSVCSQKNPHLRYLQGDKKPYLHRLELCTSRKARCRQFITISILFEEKSRDFVFLYFFNRIYYLHSER